MPQNFEDAIWNYLVFVLIVFVTTVVPLWGRCFGKGSESKVQTKADYVFATGAVSMFSMMISIARGTLGVRSFLGRKT